MKKTISFFICFCIISASFLFNSYAENETKFYLVLGDSIAYGSGLRNPEVACYGKIVADTNGFDYANHAVPGHTTSDLINKLSEQSVTEDLKKADIISISIGGNDFLTNNASDLIFDAVLENDYSQFDIIAENFYNNLCIIISTIRCNNSDAVILMQNIYNPQEGDLKAIYQQGADRINIAISRYSAEHPDEITVIDVASEMNLSDKYFAKDNIHPSSEGNEKIAKIIIEKLHSLGIGASDQPVINEKGIDIREPYLINFTVKILIFIVKTLAFFYNIA